MNKNNNTCKNISRGIAVAVLIAATICGVCGLGATFAQIPWFIIAGIICLVLIVVTVSWFMGYNSHEVQPVEEEEPVAQPTEEVIIIRRKLTPEEFDKAYNMFASEPDEGENEISEE